MDQMIEQIKMCSGSKTGYSNGELRQIAEFLMGRTDFSKIKSFLKTNNNAYYYYYGDAQGLTGEIASACAENPALLDRLGRHLAAIRHINPSIYQHLSNDFCEKLSVKAVFMDSGLGIDSLMIYLLDGYHRAPMDTPGELAMLEKDYPGRLEEYIRGKSGGSAIIPLAWLCAQRGEDAFVAKKKGLVEKLVGKKESLGELLGQWLVREMVLAVGKISASDKETFRAVVEENLPQALPALEAALKKPATRPESKFGVMIRALLLTGFKLNHVNALARSACVMRPTSFINDYLGNADREPEKVNLLRMQLPNNGLAKEQLQEEILKQMNGIIEMLRAIGVDEAYFCAWMTTGPLYANEPCWREAFDTLYREGSVAEGALSLATPLEQVALYRFLADWGRSPQLDAEAVCLDIVGSRIGELCPSDDVERMIEWLKTGEGNDLPGLGEFYAGSAQYGVPRPPHWDADFALMLLAGISPVADRYLVYLGEKGRDKHLHLCVEFLIRVLGMTPQQSAEYIASAMEPAQALLGIASSEYWEYNRSGNKDVKETFQKLVAAYPDAAQEAICAPKASAAARVELLETLYQVKPDHSSDFLIRCLGDKSKKIRQYAVSFLLPKKELADQIRPLLEAKKKDVREGAEQLMAAYEGESALAGDGDAADIVGLCTRAMPKSGRNAIKLAFPGDLPVIRWREGGDAEEVVACCYLSMLLGAKSMDLPPLAPRIREALNEDDLRDVARQVYHQWISGGAPAKQKTALLLFGVHAADSDVLELQKQIDEWAAHSRGAIAAEAVRAMAMGGGDLALMTVDSISRKFKNKQVRRCAGEAFAAAATALGTTPEALGDRIIPTLDFDERGERVVDYGNRAFTAVLSPSLSIELQDATGKKIKSLPKPGAKDDTEKAERAKAEFTALKKSLKAVVTTQTQRLEQALATGRRWDKAAWRKLFVHNPIMHSFAIGLVWGLYKGDELNGTFRYMEDGGFTTVDEDDLDLDAVEDREIGLVHPLDMADELTAQWKQQLEDYDIIQPLGQLDRPVYRMEEDEKTALAVDRFGGKKLLGITLMNKLQKSGWYRGSVQDAGCFYTFYREIGPVGMQLYFSGMYVSPDLDETITVGQACFYEAGSVNRGSYVYDDVTRENVIPLAQVSARMFSEVVLDLSAATAASADTDKNWKKDHSLLLFEGKL